jgi:hypothetical protein
MGPRNECTNWLKCTVNSGTHAYICHFLNDLHSFYPSMNAKQMYVEIEFLGGNPKDNWGQMKN